MYFISSVPPTSSGEIHLSMDGVFVIMGKHRDSYRFEFKVLWIIHYLTAEFEVGGCKYMLRHICVTIQSSRFFFKYCLLAIRLEDTSVYNPICRLVVVSWKGDHPEMSPQSCRSEVQRLFSLLLRVGCVSVATSGLEWDSNLLRFLLILSLMTSLT